MQRRTQAGGHPRLARGRAFTLIELMVVISIITILMSMLLPVLAAAKSKGRSIRCINGVRQLGMALHMFTDDNAGRLPARCHPNEWADQLLPYYVDVKLLWCPVDPNPQTSGKDPKYPASCAPRSYVMNGWNDYYKSEGIDPNVPTGTLASITEGMLREPSETIVFGEKTNDKRHFHMDFDVYDDLMMLDQSKHRTGGPRNGGGSNYVFADGSCRYLRFGQPFTPVNLWAVLPEARKTGAPTAP